MGCNGVSLRCRWDVNEVTVGCDGDEWDGKCDVMGWCKDKMGSVGCNWDGVGI